MPLGLRLQFATTSADIRRPLCSLARFTFRPTHILTFHDTSVDQVRAIFMLGLVIWKSWAVMRTWDKEEDDQEGMAQDRTRYLFNAGILKTEADRVLGPQREPNK